MSFYAPQQQRTVSQNVTIKFAPSLCQKRFTRTALLVVALYAGGVGASDALAQTATPVVSEAPAQAPVHTAWAASVRAALANRMHHAIDAGRSVLVASQHGVASWYGRRFKKSHTASGHRFDPTELTAAHPTLPMGTRIRVTSEDTGRSVIVTINDRGPFNNRIIDLSRAAAAQIGMLGAGTAHVVLSAPLGSESEVAQATKDDTSEQAISFAGRDSNHTH